MKRRTLLISSAAVFLVALAIFSIYVSRQRLQRRAVFRRVPALGRQPVAKGVPPVEKWSQTFSVLEAQADWKGLDELLDAIEKQHRDLYASCSLAYLHARTRIERSDFEGAAAKLQPYLAAGNPMRDLALFHQAEIDEGRSDAAAASRSRTELIFGSPASIYRDQAIDDESEYLAAQKSAQPMIAFASRLNGSASPERKRDLEAHVIETLVRTGAGATALPRAIALLQAGTMDDPADRASRAIDRGELTRRMNATQLALLGTAMQNHRHFDRAVALLSTALPGVPAKHDDILFSIGRSYFGDEKYAQAQQAYQRGANETRDPKQKATFLWHAARAAQLTGDDAGSERLMTAAITIPAHSPATTAALTQRMRTRLHGKRVAEATADLQQVRKLAPNSHDLVDASIAFAIAMVATGNTNVALATLNSIPPKLFDQFDKPEVAYWRGRALESRNAQAAFAAYLEVLRSTVPTHFAYFARDRVNAPAMASKLSQEVAARDRQIDELIAAKKFVDAKKAATDRILLSPFDRPHQLQRLAAIYRQLPPYREILELKPEAFPAFPLPAERAPGRASMLMAMGLFDEAADEITKRWPLHPIASGLTQSLALNRGAVSKPSIFAIEVLMKSVPDDYAPDLLPLLVRELLYPRYFYEFISEDAEKYGADPMLVLSIMREESRFNPRAKSEAAARGLLQFIITTARDIGRDVGLVDVSSDDLYDPRVIIQLGAKYIATLTKQFNGDHYAAAGAYNAGPHQVALWLRLAPGPGDDYFLSSINFDETKNYVRKVMNSYRRYGEIYGNSGPVGGLRAEP